MATPSETQSGEEAAGKKRRAEELAAAVGASVMNALGQPADLFRLSVVRLWKNYYRVNVQTGADAVTARIAHSFFLAADERGAVVESTPRITRQY